MLAQLVRIFRPDPEQTQAHILYNEIVTQARQEWFYREAGVPDTLDGRFELILLHLFLCLQRLKGQDGTEELQRTLIEVFFTDMDRSVREIGVSDTGVSRRIKAMANALYGRLDAYTKAMQDDEALKEALRRNLFATSKEADVEKMTRYIRKTHAYLDKEPIISWPEANTA